MKEIFIIFAKIFVLKSPLRPLWVRVQTINICFMLKGFYSENALESINRAGRSYTKVSNRRMLSFDFVVDKKPVQRF